MLAAIDTGQAWSDVQDLITDNPALCAGVGAALLFMIVFLVVRRRRRRRRVWVGRVPPMSRRQRRTLQRERRTLAKQDRQRRKEDRYQAWAEEKRRRKTARKGEPVPQAVPTPTSAEPRPTPPADAWQPGGKSADGDTVVASPLSAARPDAPAAPAVPPPAAPRRDHLIDVAQERLREVEARAELAQRREEEAKRLVQLKEQESERDVHLTELRERVKEAEEQAEEAAKRAEAAEVAAERSAEAVAAAAKANDDLASSVGAEQTRSSMADEPSDESSLSIPGWVSQQVTNLNKATFDQLRQVGLSVTQATRVLTQRDKEGGFDSVDALDKITGMPRRLLDEIKKRLTVD